MLSAAVVITGAEAAEVLSVAHPGENFPAERTVVWTPLFQAAWDRMNSDLEGPPVKVQPPSPLMEKLDSFEWQSGKVMPEGRWKVWSGSATPDFVATANREAAQMTGEAEGPFFQVVEQSGEPRGRLILALLDKELQFIKKLHPSASSPLVFRGGDGREQPVRFFGVKGDLSGGFSGVVRILHREEESHALQIEAEGKESLVLYLPTERESFNAACTKLREWRKEGLKGEYGSPMDPGLHGKDDLRIPYVALAAKADFQSALPALRFHKGHQEPWTIVKAEQRTKFKMTEKGAKVRAEVELGAEPFGEAPPPPPLTPRKFHFDRPFYAFMWRDGAEWPYFGAWIGDDSGMDAWK
jgi:hypothetical protein